MASSRSTTGCFSGADVLTLLQAHLICIALFAVDLIARAGRIRWYLAGLGHPVRLREALQLNAWGDAAAGLTPMRFGGEAARLAGILRAGVPATAGFMAVGLEVLVAYPVVIAFGAAIVALYSPEWWRHAGPELASRLSLGWPWVIGVLLFTLVVGLMAWRWKRVALREPRRAVQRVRHYWREMAWWPMVAGVPTSLFNVVARTLMLPVLALSLPSHPPVGVMLVGSFILLYSQLVLPTPAGAGAVDLAFLGGMAGNLGPGDGALLVAWRFYTVGAGAGLGVALALHSLGLRPLLGAVRGVMRPRGRHLSEVHQEDARGGTR